MALEDLEAEDFDLDFEARGPDGLKKCQKMMEKLVTAYRACAKKGKKIFENLVIPINSLS